MKAYSGGCPVYLGHGRPIEKSWATHKCHFFMWLVAHNKCCTAYLLTGRGLIHHPRCSHWSGWRDDHQCFCITKELLHQFEIAQDSRPFSPLEVWLINLLKTHSLGFLLCKIWPEWNLVLRGLRVIPTLACFMLRPVKKAILPILSRMMVKCSRPMKIRLIRYSLASTVGYGISVHNPLTFKGWFISPSHL